MHPLLLPISPVHSTMCYNELVDFDGKRRFQALGNEFSRPNKRRPLDVGSVKVLELDELIGAKRA